MVGMVMKVKKEWFGVKKRDIVGVGVMGVVLCFWWLFVLERYK